MKSIILKFIPALRAISAHKLRAAVSGTGIFFGISFLILSLAIYKGYRDNISQQRNIIGKDNLLITQSSPTKNTDLHSNSVTEISNGGLTVYDAVSIHKLLPSVSSVSANYSFESEINYQLINRQVKLCAVSENYFQNLSSKIYPGQDFMPLHFRLSKPVCIISSDICRSLFANKNPIGKWIKCSDSYLRVIGVLRVNNDLPLPIELKSMQTNNTVFVPVTAVLNSQLNNNSSQLEKIIVHFSSTGKTSASVDVIDKLLLRRHNNIHDFKISLPEHILKKDSTRQRNAMYAIFIVSLICLFIGGIAIMNYIYAAYYQSLLNKYKQQNPNSKSQIPNNELQVTNSKFQISNSKSQITNSELQTSNIELQTPNEQLTTINEQLSSNLFTYLSQGTIVSFISGVIGIIVGIIFSKLFFNLTKITTIVPFSSIIISFIISILLGLIFSYIPFRKNLVLKK